MSLALYSGMVRGQSRWSIGLFDDMTFQTTSGPLKINIGSATAVPSRADGDL
jgi:hypothetical protein